MSNQVGWCPVCEREGMLLRQYYRHDGRPAMACEDERACCEAFARKHPPGPRTRTVLRYRTRDTMSDQTRRIYDNELVTRYHNDPEFYARVDITRKWLCDQEVALRDADWYAMNIVRALFPR